MWIVAIAWIYVALMMAMAEATSAQGTALGAVITFLFYGVGPVALVMYLLGAPARRRALKQREAQAREAHVRQQAQAAETPAQASDQPSDQADGRSPPPGDAIPPGRKAT